MAVPNKAPEIVQANYASSGQPTYQTLHDLVASDLERVNQAILTHIKSSTPLIPQLAQHLIAAGGKRLRPLLTLGSAQMFGYEGDHHILLAASVEFIHTATLLHDDVVDGSDLRRGQATANTVWGNTASVLVGDFLFSKAFELMVKTGTLPVLDTLAKTSNIIAEGEVKQLMLARNVDITVEQYIEVVTAKTAQLFEAATEVGALVANRPEAECRAMAEFGKNLGIAFQIVDDIIDYSSAADVSGKNSGDDFRDGKLTLPIILAVAKASEHEQKFWRRTFEDLDQKPEDLGQALEILGKHDALSKAKQMASSYADLARKNLADFPPSPVKAAFEELIDFCLARCY